MRVLFCGARSGIGTSAGMSALRWGLSVMCNIQSRQVYEAEEFLKARPQEMVCFDTGEMRGEVFYRLLHLADLVVLNISQTGSGLEQFYLDHQMVHTNLLLLVGKYHNIKENSLHVFEQQYRIDSRRICAIPFNMRFHRAYEDGRMLSFIRKELRWTDNWENQQFLWELIRTMQALMNYAVTERGNNYG